MTLEVQKDHTSLRSDSVRVSSISTRVNSLLENLKSHESQTGRVLYRTLLDLNVRKYLVTKFLNQSERWF